MSGTAVIIIWQGVIGARTELDDHFLKFADGKHVIKQLQGSIAVKSARGNFFFQSFIERITLDDAAINVTGGEIRFAVAKIIRHDIFLPLQHTYAD